MEIHINRVVEFVGFSRIDLISFGEFLGKKSATQSSKEPVDGDGGNMQADLHLRLVRAAPLQNKIAPKCFFSKS